MLPVHLLPRLSPHAAKVYLVLLAHIDPYHNRVHTRLPMPRLTELSGLSPRACSRAIHELKDLHLVKVPAYRYHATRTYQLTSPPPAPKSNPTVSPAQATLSQNAPPAATPTPDITPKRQVSPPQATLLNNRGPNSPAPRGESLRDLYLRELTAAAATFPPPDPVQRLRDQVAAAMRGEK